MDEGPHIINKIPGHGIREQYKIQNNLGTKHFKRNWTREQPTGTRKKKGKLTEITAQLQESIRI